jgi:hypothetical protein
VAAGAQCPRAAWQCMTMLAIPHVCAGKAGSENGLEFARAMQAVERRDWVRVLAAQAEARSTGRPALAVLSGAPVPVDADVVSEDRATAMQGLGDKLCRAFVDLAALVVSMVRAPNGDGGKGR